MAATCAILVLTPVPVGVILRDGAAFAGLAALATALLGRHLAWTFPAAAAAGAMIPAAQEPFALLLLTWAAQPAACTSTVIVATTIVVAGFGAYLAVGSRHTADKWA